MASLDQNIEGLRTHAIFTNIFIDSADITPAQRKWRSWLAHCLMKTARHYNEARALILAQIGERERSPAELMKGRQLPLFDFSLEMEDCITSLDKTITCIKILAEKNELPAARVLELKEEMQRLKEFRNKQEHMHKLIAAGQTGDGPILVVVADEGDSMKLLKLTMPFAAVHSLIGAAYRDISGLFPAHDPLSPATPAGTLQLSGTVTFEIISASNDC